MKCPRNSDNNLCQAAAYALGEERNLVYSGCSHGKKRTEKEGTKVSHMIVWENVLF
jgi:hypothetical protein